MIPFQCDLNRIVIVVIYDYGCIPKNGWYLSIQAIICAYQAMGNITCVPMQQTCKADLYVACLYGIKRNPGGRLNKYLNL